MRRWLVATILLAAACGPAAPKAETAPSTSTSTSAASTVAPPPTPAPSLTISAGATTSSTLTTIVPPSTASAAAGCESFDAAASLTQPGTVVRVVCLRRAGAGPLAAVQSVRPATGAAPPAPDVVVFANDGGRWSPLVDLVKLPSGEQVTGLDGQIVETLAAVDFSGGGSDWLTVAVLSVGASDGPLSIRVLSFSPGDTAVAYEEDTVSGGEVSVVGNHLELVTGSYAPGDPHCCPSGVDHETIAWNPEYKVVTRTAQTVTTQP